MLARPDDVIKGRWLLRRCDPDNPTRICPLVPRVVWLDGLGDSVSNDVEWLWDVTNWRDPPGPSTLGELNTPDLDQRTPHEALETAKGAIHISVRWPPVGLERWIARNTEMNQHPVERDVVLRSVREQFALARE